MVLSPTQATQSLLTLEREKEDAVYIMSEEWIKKEMKSWAQQHLEISEASEERGWAFWFWLYLLI